jgi:hypothetical protein
MDRMDSVARRLDRSLTRDVVFAVAGPIALGAALGMLVVSWSSYGTTATTTTRTTSPWRQTRRRTARTTTKPDLQSHS